MIKSTIHTVKQIWDILEERERMEFKRSCFGHFTELDSQMTADPQKKGGFSGQLVHYVLCKIVDYKKSSKLWFNFDGKPTRFSVYEFAVVTGLRCSELLVNLRLEACQSHLRDNYFKTNSIKISDLLNKIQKWPRGKPQEDRLKIALVYFLESTLLSSDPKKSVSQHYLSMVDDLDTFNKFPWGSIVYPATLEQLQSRDLRA
ncbi:hypothetical protein UlMin_008922 [Ulmus minor]